MISGSILLIFAPIVVAAGVYFVRRFTLVAAAISVGAAAGFTWLITALPQSPEETILGGRVVGGGQVILGRTLVFTPSDRAVLVALGLTIALLLVLAARLRPGDIFFPGMLALLGVIAGVLATETFAFAVLLMEVAAGLVTMLLQGARFGSTRGPWRFFLYATLAMPFLLVAGWQADFQAANPGQTEMLNTAVLLLSFGFGIYLTAVPFHFWLAPVTSESPPLTQIAALGCFQIAALSVVLDAMERFPWLVDSPTPFQWFTLAGTLTAGLGALLAFRATTPAKLAAYSLLVDMGAVLILLGLRSPDGLHAAWAVLLLRIIGMTIWSIGLANSGERSTTGPTAVLVLGGLSLAGFPLTPGFAGRWMAIGLIAREDIARAVVLLLGSASATAGVLHMVKTTLVQQTDPSRQQDAGRWDWLRAAALLVIIITAVVLALYPTPLITAAKGIAGHFISLYP